MNHLLAKLVAQAQTGVSTGEAGGTPIQAPVITGDSLETIVSRIIGIILIVVGILVVVYLIYGGILYITAGGDADKAGKGRTAITNAIIGLIIVIVSYAIYNFVLTRISKQGAGGLQMQNPATYRSPY